MMGFRGNRIIFNWFHKFSTSRVCVNTEMFYEGDQIKYIYRTLSKLITNFYLLFVEEVFNENDIKGCLFIIAWKQWIVFVATLESHVFSIL